MEFKKRTNITLLLVLLLIYFKLLVPTIKVANDLHFAYPEEVLGKFQAPSIWGAAGAVGFGEYAVSVLWNWPMNFLFGTLGTIGISYSHLLILLGILPVFLFGIWGIRRILEYYDISESGILVATLFFLTNTYLILLLDGGQLNLALAYAILPLSFLQFKKSADATTFMSVLKTGLLMTLITIFDIRALYIFFLLLFLEFVYSSISQKALVQNISTYFKTGFPALLITLGLHAYWIVPSFFAKAPSLPETYGRVSQTQFLNFTTWKHALLLLQPHWYKNVFGQIPPIDKKFIVVPFLVLLAPFLIQKNQKLRKIAWFWVFIAIISIFLVKGANQPLSGVYPWLFSYIPGFSLFRDSTKFFFLLALSYSVLMGITISELMKRFQWNVVIFKSKVPLLPALVIAYFLFLFSPVWLGKMNGTFSKPIYQNEYFAIADLIKSDPSFGRILWLPTKAPLGYSSSNHPSVEAFRLAQLRPFAIGVIGNYELFNFLRDAPFIDQILKVSGIKYVAYPYPDERRQDLKDDEKEYYDRFLGQLTIAPWSEEQITVKPVPLLRTREASGHFFLAPNHFFIIGSDNIYWDLAKMNDFDLSKNAFTFAEEKKSSVDFQSYPDSKVILYKKDLLDFTLSQVQAKQLIFPAKELAFDPDETGWWKRETADLIAWRAFLQEKYGLDNLDFDYGGGWAVAEGNNSKFKVKDEMLRKGDILFARMMKSSKGGSVKFYQNETKLAEVSTKEEVPETEELVLHGYQDIPDQVLEYDDTNVSWYEIGKLISNEPVRIETEGDINVVNAFTTLTEEEYRNAQEKSQKLIDDGRVVDWTALSENEKSALFNPNALGSIEYERINPTHYKVKVSGITHPQTLVFSESYDPMWQIDGKPSIEVYSFLNGFQVDNNKEFDIYFSAQKYVWPGLVISGITLASVIGLLFVLRKK